MSNKYYFTYGTEGYPYYGGWTIVIADSTQQAISLFRVVHPDKEKHALNCAAIYSEETFPIDMLKNGNFGNYAHEVIQIIVASCTPAINVYVTAKEI